MSIESLQKRRKELEREIARTEEFIRSRCYLPSQRSRGEEQIASLREKIARIEIAIDRAVGQGRLFGGSSGNGEGI